MSFWNQSAVRYKGLRSLDALLPTGELASQPCHLLPHLCLRVRGFFYSFFILLRFLAAMLCFVLVLILLSPVSAFNVVRFSNIQQCGPFNLTFEGPQPTALPLTLTVVPFGSPAVPLSIPLPNPEWDSKMSTGVAITFLPYPAGTTFVASLDDANGQSTGLTSDIIKILQSDNSSCLSTTKQSQTYTPEPPFSQCQPFDVAFDPTQATPPVVRSFTPNGPALFLNPTQGSTGPGISAFNMVAFRGQPVILLFGDGSDLLQSTDLLTVTGDATSSNRCFPNPPNKSQQAGLSRSVPRSNLISCADSPLGKL